MHKLIIGVLVLATRIAAADDQQVSRGYVGVSAGAGVEHVGYAGGNLDGGFRIAHTPLFVHAQLSAGGATTVTSDGTYSLLRAGVEGRWCPSSIACLTGGVDAGRRHIDLDDEDDLGRVVVREDESYLIVVPRLSAEFGRRLQMRVALETPTSMRENEALVGFGFSIGAAYNF